MQLLLLLYFRFMRLAMTNKLIKGDLSEICMQYNIIKQFIENRLIKELTKLNREVRLNNN